jgi:hypothetical protein
MNKKLTFTQVQELIKKHTQGAKLRELSAAFGISISQAGRITSRENWKQAH